MKGSGRPNIVFLVIDSLRADHVSSYGYCKKTTPCIDSISRDAILFESAISPSGWTLPVFLSMLTGTYPSKHGMGQHLNMIPTIMGVLHEYDYKTLGITDTPYLNVISREFDEFSYLNSKSDYLKEISRERKIALKLSASMLRYGSHLNLGTYVRDFLKNGVAAGWIDKYSREGPFFMLVHQSVHWPYEPPDPFFSTFIDGYPKELVDDIRRDLYALIAEQVALPERAKVLNSLYDGLVAWTDSCVGRLVDQLKKSGAYDNTILVITADHGDLLGEHGLLSHAFSLYEPLIRVPLIIRFPDSTHRGMRFPGLVQTLDLFPTLVECLDLNRNRALREAQGKSILSIVEGRDERAFAISERADSDPESKAGQRNIKYLEDTYPGYQWRKLAHRISAVRTPEYKYIQSSEGRDELYDLRQDPQESNNIISSETQTASELGNTLDMWKGTFVGSEQEAVELELEASVKERLRRLGYL